MEGDTQSNPQIVLNFACSCYAVTEVFDTSVACDVTI